MGKTFRVQLIQKRILPMSVFNNGGGTLGSSNLPAALFEIAGKLDAAETARNAAFPTLAPKQNITTTVDFGTKNIAIAATIPATFSPNASGSLVVDASDYLGSGFSGFTPGTGGTLKSTDIVSAFVELAQITSNAEKTITPIEDQPNNLQVTYDAETLTITVTASLPAVISFDANGAVLVIPVDYIDNIVG